MITSTAGIAYGCAIAFGIGLLMGLERERRKAEIGGRSPGGIRTFPIAAVSGAVAVGLGGEVLLGVAVLCAGALVTAAYLRMAGEDPGVTTEFTLILSVLLGGLAVREPALASGIAVVVTVLLAARSALHTFARERLSPEEVRDGLIFAASALVIWPLLPDQSLGPLSAFNLQNIWKVVVLVMGAGGVGYIAVRVFGARLGLPFSGFASGFASSSATISSMGARAAEHKEALGAATAGATLSSVATFIESGALLAMMSREVFAALLLPLAAGGVAALVYGGVFTIIALKKREEVPGTLGRPFDPRVAAALAAAVALAAGLAALLNHLLGAAGVLAGSAVMGFPDAHAATTAVATLAANGQMGTGAAGLAVLTALTANTGLKILMALAARNWAFALRVIPGLLLAAAAMWVPALLLPFPLSF